MIRLSADNVARTSVGVFILSCSLLTISYSSTFVFDRPINSAVLTSFLAGSTLLALGKLTHRVPESNSHAQKYSIIPLTELFELPNREPSPAVNGSHGAKARNLTRIRVALVALICCIRVELYRQFTINVECAPAPYEYAIPFIISLYDYWRNQLPALAGKDVESNDLPDARCRLLVTRLRRIRFHLLQSRQRYIYATALLLGGGLLASSFHQGRHSTYICPLITGQAPRLRAFRFLSIIIDTSILIGAAELSRSTVRSPEGSRKQTPVLWGYGLLGVSIFWTLVGIILSRRNTAPGDSAFSSDSQYFRSALGQSLLVTLLLTSASQIISHYGIVGLSMLAGFIGVCFSSTAALANGQQPFPLIIPSHAFVSFVATLAGLALFLFARAASEEEPQPLLKINILLRLSLLFLLFIGSVFTARQPSVANLHPIDLLIYNARISHDTWFTQARASNSLEEAVAEYQRRYNQHPPPGFDKWYDFATSRSSVVIDDFDQIYLDLLPFRSLSPERLRELTHQLATNPYNDIGAISIRNGAPKLQEGIKPTHAWMVSGAAKMIEKFSEHLPDMDIAFNLNDEPRLAVPWEKTTPLKNSAKAQPLPSNDGILNGWSMDRGQGWAPLEPADQTTETVFVDDSRRPNFYRYASQTCPPSSDARSQRIWDRGKVCLSCIRPHSMGQFPSDWRRASDICHQPDLASLHGFMISPAAFKVSRELVPVFSQSTVPGFSDILYPSPWNYVDKVKYDPSVEYPDSEFVDKENTLFWIGSTSEGVSHHGAWQGMVRQRFTHLINNNTLNKVSVLLPTNNGSETYSYQIMDGRAPSERLGLNASVHLSDPPVRCDDCELQQQELATASWVNFQKHWSYRYLFDLDGAGFSGRFLPFMQSHSLPFKTALFRQWFDSRITGWLHFVPVDLRLHGVWSTLAYFAGANVTEHGQSSVLMNRRDVEGKWIAEEGRKWAQQALRKEDMEIYFFRLLLEWARLTDDRRDMLGFKLQ